MIEILRFLLSDFWHGFFTFLVLVCTIEAIRDVFVSIFSRVDFRIMGRLKDLEKRLDDMDGGK